MSAAAPSFPSVLAALLDLTVPSRCIACRAPRRDIGGGGACRECWASLLPLGPSCPRCALPDSAGECAECRRDPPAIDRAVAAGVYAGSLAKIVIAYKFRGFDTLAAPAAKAMARALAAAALSPPDALVPVPSTPRRNRERGYDPALLLARALGRRTGRPVHRLLRRLRDDLPQSRLAAAARRTNLHGAFAARGVPKGRLLLVDDVSTTGATAREAASALEEAGAAYVDLAVLARTPRPEDFRHPEIS